jgi:hypothetical protein
LKLTLPTAPCGAPKRRTECVAGLEVVLLCLTGARVLARRCCCAARVGEHGRLMRSVRVPGETWGNYRPTDVEPRYGHLLVLATAQVNYLCKYLAAWRYFWAIGHYSARFYVGATDPDDGEPRCRGPCRDPLVEPRDKVRQVRHLRYQRSQAKVPWTKHAILNPLY